MFDSCFSAKYGVSCYGVSKVNIDLDAIEIQSAIVTSAINRVLLEVFENGPNSDLTKSGFE